MIDVPPPRARKKKQALLSFRVSDDDRDKFRRAVELYKERYPKLKVTDSDVLRAAVDTLLKILEEEKAHIQGLIEDYNNTIQDDDS